MKRNSKKNIVKRCAAMAFALVMMLTGSLTLPVSATTDAYSTTQTLDAVADVAICDGSNPNNVESPNITFEEMVAITDSVTNDIVASEKGTLISVKQVSEKTAFVLQFQKPIDANKIEYLSMGMFAGAGCRVRAYNSQVRNFVEDTAQDVFEFSSWQIEKKTLALREYADKDGYVRNITFYIASVATKRNFIIDYFSLTEYKEATEDCVLKAGVNTSGIYENLGENQVPSFPLGDEGLLKQLGWDAAIYTDGSPERILKPGKYMTLSFDKVNTKYYEKIEIDFYTSSELEFTMYVYGADELYYNRENAAQIVTLKGGEATRLKLDAAKLADEYGYVSQVNLLLVRHSNKTNEGFQIFLGDVTLKLPREYANVNIYTEKQGGGYEKSAASTTIEGMAGEPININPYKAEELGLYGYEYNSGAKNVLSGLLTEDRVIELKLYYKLKNCKVTVNNDGEAITKTVKYGTKLDLMEYRKDNMLMNILVDGIETKDTKVSIMSDCEIDLTQTPGNYVFFMVEDELFATRTYTPEEMTLEEPSVPIKIGYAGAWEEYELDGTDKTVHAVYTPSAVESGKSDADDNVIINVANKMKEVTDYSMLSIVLGALAIVAVLIGIVVLLIILIRKGKLAKRQIMIGGAAVAVACVTVCFVSFWDVIFPTNENSKVVEETYTFDELYTSEEEKTIKPQETLTYNIDKELVDKNYIEIDVDTDVNLLGTIEYYNLADSSQTNEEEFFLEGASSEVFHQFLDNFRENGSGNFEKHLTAITLTNVSEEDGKVTLNKVAISERAIDMSRAELYVENDYLKVGMDLMCGGALTYLERLPYDGETVQEILDSSGNVAVGLNYGEKKGATLLSDSVNLVNIYDKGREVQQSFYADVYEENGYVRGSYVAQNNKEWPYNPVQGGDQDNNSSQIIDYRVEENTLYVKTRAMDWGQHNSTTKSYMENWYTLKNDMLYVKNRFIDWNGFTGETNAINNEMPAVYFAQAFNKFTTYEGNAPWTGASLDTQESLGSWVNGGHVNENPSEGWFAWLNEDNFGIGMYIPGIKTYVSGRADASTSASADQNSNAADSFMLRDYRPKNTSDYTQCYVSNTCYTAPVLRTTMDQYVPLEYSYVICIDNLDNIRSGFQDLAQEEQIDNSGLEAWD